MAGPQKKTAKGRLDKWYKLAKEQGYRSRAAFKLVQLAKKYNFLEGARVVIDLCAAPGGWLQVCSKQCKPGALLIGVDLVPIKPIPNVITFAEDINSDRCRTILRQHMKTWKADCVIHDGAPNVGTAWLQDAYTQAELVLMSLRLATEFLMPGGTFVTKVFRSKDYNSLMWVFNQFFRKVEATKPQASRNVSAEIFVVCREYKAPQKIDPKLLDPKAVFEDLPDVTPNQEAKIFHPEKRRRQREGYEEGNYTQHKTRTAYEFVSDNDPITMLGLTQEFVWDEDDESRKLKKHPLTTREIIECAKDLQVLGKKDFRGLLKWRLALRDEFGIGKVDEEPKEVAEVEELDEEEQIDRDIEAMSASEKTRQKRDRRRANERKQKEIVRMQMGMDAGMDIALDEGRQRDDTMFDLREIERRKQGLDKVSAGADPEDQPPSSDEEELSEDELEDQLDHMYERFKEQRAMRDAKFRAKRARGDGEDGEWSGIQDKRDGAADDEDDDDEVDSDDDGQTRLSTKLVKTNGDAAPAANGALSKRAALFFNQDLFQGMSMDDPEAKPAAQSATTNGTKQVRIKESAFEEVPAEQSDAESSDDDRDADDESDDGRGLRTKKSKNAPASIDIVTAEAMTLARELASKRKSKNDIIDEGYNRRSFLDKDGLPEWFLDDETKHNKPNLPVSKEAMEALRERMRAMNARPIKKILEAQGRKRQRAMRVLQRAQQRATAINEQDDLTEREKAASISRVLSRASKSRSLGGGKKGKKGGTQVVVATKGSKTGGRPSGTKGRYKMVDARLKKETRALKRIAKRKK
ncbi:AdoMet-dependent rRNA methyltransferase spb1 [Savitreella phatthalungensis]